MGLHHRRKHKLFSRSKHSKHKYDETYGSVSRNPLNRPVDLSDQVENNLNNNNNINMYDEEISSDFSSHSDDNPSDHDPKETSQEVSIRLAKEILQKYEQEQEERSESGDSHDNNDHDKLSHRLKQHRLVQQDHVLPISHLINPDIDDTVYSKLHSVPTCLCSGRTNNNNAGNKSTQLYVALKDGSILKYSLEKTPHTTSTICTKPTILIGKYDPTLRNTYIYETKGVNDIDYNPHDTSVRYGRNMRCVLGLCVDGNNSSDKNGTKICVGTGDGFVRVYRERNKEGTKDNKLELLTEWRKHKGPVVCLGCRNGELFSGSTDRLIHHYTLSTLGYIQTLYGHQNPLSCLHTMPLLLSTSQDRTIRLWNTQSQSHLIFRSGRQVLCVCGVSESWFVTGSACGLVGLWHVKRKSVFKEYVNEEDKKGLSALVGKIKTNKNSLYERPITALQHHSDVLAVGSKNTLNLYRIQVEDLTDKDTKARGDLQWLRSIIVFGYVNDVVIVGRWCVGAVGREMREGRWDVVKGGKNRLCWIEMWKEGEKKEKKEGKKMSRVSCEDDNGEIIHYSSVEEYVSSDSVEDADDDIGEQRKHNNLNEDDLNLEEESDTNKKLRNMKKVDRILESIKTDIYGTDSSDNDDEEEMEENNTKTPLMKPHKTSNDDSFIDNGEGEEEDSRDKDNGKKSQKYGNKKDKMDTVDSQFGNNNKYDSDGSGCKSLYEEGKETSEVDIKSDSDFIVKLKGRIQNVNSSHHNLKVPFNKSTSKAKKPQNHDDSEESYGESEEINNKNNKNLESKIPEPNQKRQKEYISNTKKPEEEESDSEEDEISQKSAISIKIMKPRTSQKERSHGKKTLLDDSEEESDLKESDNDSEDNLYEEENVPKKIASNNKEQPKVSNKSTSNKKKHQKDDDSSSEVEKYDEDSDDSDSEQDNPMQVDYNKISNKNRPKVSSKSTDKAEKHQYGDDSEDASDSEEEISSDDNEDDPVEEESGGHYDSPVSNHTSTPTVIRSRKLRQNIMDKLNQHIQDEESDSDVSVQEDEYGRIQWRVDKGHNTNGNDNKQQDDYSDSDDSIDVDINNRMKEIMANYKNKDKIEDIWVESNVSDGSIDSIVEFDTDCDNENNNNNKNSNEKKRKLNQGYNNKKSNDRGIKEKKSVASDNEETKKIKVDDKKNPKRNKNGHNQNNNNDESNNDKEFLYFANQDPNIQQPSNSNNTTDKNVGKAENDKNDYKSNQYFMDEESLIDVNSRVSTVEDQVMQHDNDLDNESYVDMEQFLGDNNDSEDNNNNDEQVNNTKRKQDVLKKSPKNDSKNQPDDDLDSEEENETSKFVQNQTKEGVSKNQSPGDESDSEEACEDSESSSEEKTNEKPVQKQLQKPFSRNTRQQKITKNQPTEDKSEEESDDDSESSSEESFDQDDTLHQQPRRFVPNLQDSTTPKSTKKNTTFSFNTQSPSSKQMDRRATPYKVVNKKVESSYDSEESGDGTRDLYRLSSDGE